MSSERNKLLYLITEFVLISLLILTLTLDKERRIDPSGTDSVGSSLPIEQQISHLGD